jgi:hypothetical protein
MTPDPALNTFSDGRYGSPYQGYVAPGYMRNPTAIVATGTLPGVIDVNIISPIPLQVEQVNEPLLPVETAMAQLGIIKDAVTGEPIGRVMLSRVTNEETGVITETRTAYFENGTVTPNYTGTWAVEGDCSVATPEGVLPTWG